MYEYTKTLSWIAANCKFFYIGVLEETLLFIVCKSIFKDSSKPFLYIHHISALHDQLVIGRNIAAGNRYKVR